MSARNSLLAIGGAIGCLVMLFCVGMLIVAALFVAPALSFSFPVVNRIAYLDNENNIRLVDARGENPVAITRDASSARLYTFPTFAPNSQSIAFMGIAGAPTQREGALYAAPIAGGAATIVFKSATDFPFYLYWAPDNQRITFLTQSEKEMALMVGYADGKQTARTLETGAPLYWAWSPDSQALFLHAGGSRRDSPRARLAFLRGDNAQTLDPGPAGFQAPQFSPDGAAILYAASDARGQDGLYAADAHGSRPRLISNYRGRIAFAWAPDGNALAWIVTPASIRLPHFGAVDLSAKDGSNPARIVAEDALAFFWSPDSQKIAYLTIVRAGEEQNCAECSRAPGVAAPLEQDALRLRWRVVTVADRQTKILATFSPTAEFLTLLPFFDQYARSLTFWSPDSAQFVYTQRDGNTDQASVWIANVSGDAKPRRIGDGALAVWSWR